MTNTSNHGGKREGAGRKNLSTAEPTKIVTVRMPQSHYEWLAKQGIAADTIRRLVRQAMEGQGQ